MNNFIAKAYCDEQLYRGVFYSDDEFESDTRTRGSILIANENLVLARRKYVSILNGINKSLRMGVPFRLLHPDFDALYFAETVWDDARRAAETQQSLAHRARVDTPLLTVLLRAIPVERPARKSTRRCLAPEFERNAAPRSVITFSGSKTDPICLD